MLDNMGLSRDANKHKQEDVAENFYKVRCVATLDSEQQWRGVFWQLVWPFFLVFGSQKLVS